MAEVVLYHHALGLTRGVHAFADALRQGGHAVHTPDLYEGRTFAALEDGVAHAEAIGVDAVLERGARAAEELPEALVYVGISLGVLPAQRLAQTRTGARGAVLISACVPPGAFGAPWPAGVPLQIHAMDGDAEFRDGGDLAAARALDGEVDGADLFLYPGSGHLFVDDTSDAFDARAAARVRERTLALLAEA